MLCSDFGLLRVMTPFDLHSQRAKGRQRGPGGLCGPGRLGIYTGTYMGIWGAMGTR